MVILHLNVFGSLCLSQRVPDISISLSVIDYMDYK